MSDLITSTHKIAVHQMCSGIDAAANTETICAGIAAAAKAGAVMYYAPEMSVLLDKNKKRAASQIFVQEQNAFLIAIGNAAKNNNIWVHIGSAAVSSENDSQKYNNRSLVFDNEGAVRATYDKIHLFDVDLPDGESYRESSSFVAGYRTAMVQTPIGALGLTICYDLRYPALFSALSGAGAAVFAVPAAFTKTTGQAHWHILLKARAIENAAYVIAAAQSGQHEDGRQTYGHSLVIDPWGDVILDMGEGEGIGYAQIDIERVNAARSKIPVIQNRRDILGDVVQS
jgi:deaminated glutathione amidase